MSDQHPHTGTVPDYDILNTRNNSSIYNEALGRTASRSVQARNSFFYASAFKQLHSLQQKQVGLLVGAAVADAALKPLTELSSMNALSQLIAEGEESQSQNSVTDVSPSTTRKFEDSSMRPNLRLIKDEMAPVSDEGILTPVYLPHRHPSGGLTNTARMQLLLQLLPTKESQRILMQFSQSQLVIPPLLPRG